MQTDCQRSTRRLACLLAAALLAVAMPLSLARAQRGAPPQSASASDSVPRELVSALFGLTRSRTLVVDTMGAGLPAALLHDARVLGSMGNDFSSTTAAILPYTAEVAADSLDARLTVLGWRRPPAPPEPRGRGFSSRPRLALPQLLCRDSAYLSPRIVSPRGDSTLVTISVSQTRGGYSPCDRSSRIVRLEETPMPALTPRPGQEFEQQSTSGSNDGWDARAMARGRLNVAETVRYHSAQVTRQGWTALDQSLTEDVGLATFRTTGTDGRPWFGILTVIAAPDAPRTLLSFRISPIGEAR